MPPAAPRAGSGTVPVVSLLQTDPNIGAVAAQLAETDSRLRGDRHPLRQDAMQVLVRHAERAGSARRGHAEGGQSVLAEDLPGMDQGPCGRSGHSHLGHGHETVAGVSKSLSDTVADCRQSIP